MASNAQRVLLFTRNDKHHREVEQALGRGLVVPWLEAAGIDVTAVSGASLPSRDELAGYAVYMPWLMPQWDQATGAHTHVVPAEAEAIKDFVCGGGGLFGLHGATVVPAVEPYAAYLDVLGTRFVSHPRYHEFAVRVRRPDHPVTRGLADFRTSDELYLHEPLAADAGVLLDAEWEGRPQPMAYTRTVGAGQVFYLALGHDRASWEHPAFKHLVVEGTRWLLSHAARPAPAAPAKA